MDQFVWHLEKPLIYFRLMLKKTGTAKNGLGRKKKKAVDLFGKFAHLFSFVIYNYRQCQLT